MSRFGIARCRGEVPINVWIRGDLACSPPPAAVDVLLVARAIPQIVEFRPLAISLPPEFASRRWGQTPRLFRRLSSRKPALSSCSRESRRPGLFARAACVEDHDTVLIGRGTIFVLAFIALGWSPLSGAPGARQMLLRSRIKGQRIAAAPAVAWMWRPYQGGRYRESRKGGVSSAGWEAQCLRSLGNPGFRVGGVFCFLRLLPSSYARLVWSTLGNAGNSVVLGGSFDSSPDSRELLSSKTL